MKAETRSCCVLLINYILRNKVVLHYKFIYFINYWKHDGDALPENCDALYVPDRFEESGQFSLLPHTAAVRNSVFCPHSVFVFCVILQ